MSSPFNLPLIFELNTLNAPAKVIVGRRLKIAVFSQPEYFRFMYEHELESFAEIFEFKLQMDLSACDLKPLIEYQADYNFFFRGECLPDGVLEQINGVRVPYRANLFRNL